VSLKKPDFSIWLEKALQSLEKGPAPGLKRVQVPLRKGAGMDWDNNKGRALGPGTTTGHRRQVRQQKQWSALQKADPPATSPTWKP